MDVANIFLAKQEPLSDDYCERLLESVEDYLEQMDSFVFENKLFVNLPDHERGHFFSCECYVFLCKMVIPVRVEYSKHNDQEGEECKMETKYKVYFWEGCDCHRTGYLTFAFSLRRKFEECFGDKLTIERIHQQQEPLEFLALFHPVYVLHRGFRKRKSLEPSLYQIRNTMGMLTLRCIEIDFNSQLLCSRLYYVLKDEKKSKVFLWIGSKSEEKERNAANLIINSFNHESKYEIIELHENEEGEEFWELLDGKKEYDIQGTYIDYARLFRCSNETGFYAIKEKYSDYSQFDLVFDDVMMFDDGAKVFLWEGPKASDLEKSLSKKLAPVYVQNCKNFNIGFERTIKIIQSGEEPLEFRRAFQGWKSKFGSEENQN